MSKTLLLIYFIELWVDLFYYAYYKCYNPYTRTQALKQSFALIVKKYSLALSELNVSDFCRAGIGVIKAIKAVG